MSPPADATPERGSRAEELRARLALAGLAADVDADGALAILRFPATFDVNAPQLDARMRGELVTMARECGFTHLAIELTPERTDARPEPSDADVRRAEPRT